MKGNKKKICLAFSLALLMCFGVVGCGSNNNKKTSQTTATESENIDDMSDKQKQKLKNDIEEAKVDGMNVTNYDGEVLTSKKDIEKFTQELIKKYEPLANGKKLYCSPGTHACIDDDGNIYSDDSGKPEKWTPVKGQKNIYQNASGDETDNTAIIEQLESARERGHKNA